MRPARRSLLLVASVAAAWTIAVALTGGFSARLAHVTFASRDPFRPLIVAAIAAGIYAWRFRGHAAEDAAWCNRLARKSAAPAAVTLAVAICVIAIRWGTFAASGSDAYGYVSQADLWLHRGLRVPQPWVEGFGWPDVTWTFTPLGYRPSSGPATTGTIVPGYPSGLPMLMAAAKVVLGGEGPFYVVPMFGALAVWLTYLMGRDWTNDRLAGALAALLLAVSPVFLYQLMWPMTDVPVTALWAAAFLTAFRPHKPQPMLAGLAAGAALLVRPNLLLMTLAMPAAWLWPTRRRRLQGRHVSMIARYAVGLLPCTMLAAGLQIYLYGSPIASGYGDFGEIYSTRNVLANLTRYGRWLIESQTPLVALAVVALAVKSTLRSEDDWVSRRAGFCAATVLLALSYVSYAVFDAWWYLRFFLPVFPMLCVLIAAASLWLLRQIPSPLRLPIAIAVFVPFAAYEVNVASDRAAFAVKTYERRYVDAARQVAAATPPDAVVFSMQHSGSVRYYAARKTLRYDLLPPEWLERAVAALTARGFPCFVLLDDWEEPVFRARFGAVTSLGGLDWKPLAEVFGPVRVRLFALPPSSGG